MSNIDWSGVITKDDKAISLNTELRAAANAKRDLLVVTPTVVTITGEGTFPVDMGGNSQTNLLGLTTSAMLKTSVGDTSSITFTDANNTEHRLSPAQLLELGPQVMAYVSALHGIAKLVKADIDRGVITTVDEINSDARWPSLAA